MSSVRAARWLHLAVVALVACSAGRAQAQDLTPRRNGSWLQNGIELSRRLEEHQSISQPETEQARITVSYVCAIVDLEKYLVFRADLLKGAVTEARKHRRLNPQELKGIGEVLPLLIPLMDTRFFQDVPSCDKAVLIVRDYLSKYPEVLDKDAEVIVEKALLDAYSNEDAP